MTLKIATLIMTVCILLPSVAEACSGHRKPVRCSSYTNINGTTKSTCR